MNKIMRSRRLGFALVLAVLLALAAKGFVAAGGVGMWRDAQTPRPSFAQDSLLIQQSDGRTHRFQVELARTSAEQAYGLMFVTHLDPDAGMLFLNERDSPQRFWMKNTFISLDILFIAADGRIVNIVSKAKPLSLKRISSDGPVRATLEIRGGRAEDLGIRPGDRVVYRDLHP